METAEDYVNGGSIMQRRDVQDFVEEFDYEMSKMGGRCLDIGSGPGDITKELILPLLSNDAEIVGADISQAMVNYAREKHSDERVSYTVLDIETLELPSDQVEQYNNVVSFNCLHWCNDMWRAFENIYKLLQPNGKALVMFAGYHCGFNAYLLLKQNPRYESYLEDARRYVPYFQRRKCKDIRASLRKMLETVGFEILHCSKREKSFQYSRQSLKSHVYAINPFIKRIPDDLKDEFIDHLMSEIINQTDFIPLKSENSQEERIMMRYDLLIAYVQKPSPVA
ncbi:PREDICTED: uncharacterized protein LOC105564253 [Vollenhovia emeryi]|uniref:uncharacterized protein LOC105564253 n=1 Tax=Vollenhovia emeryi TaxID=411798 RepID=UPI0005F39E5C|nr:PREDICTED: uncharacterized protein LOC105564253 [Vollenhovia emeryi]XP_011871885.1 PREDICTED: uncharacterized protein LOC105564253 [Vollenhovia emeryi]XP_011871886.1 PREDICTED: uncharacterized protein LOC105564253 [Vollenhovia emeryi]